MAERERALAKRRLEIESRDAARLLRKRQQLPQIDWTNPPNFEDEAARKLRSQNLAKIDRKFSPEAFLDLLVPSLLDFASYVAMFERTVIARLPPFQRHAHQERVVAAIVVMMFPRTPGQVPLPPEARHVRLSEEKAPAGEVIAGPFEILLDEQRRPIGYRRAPYAERHGEFEHLPLANMWGLLRVMKKERRLLCQALKARLRSDFVEMLKTTALRKQMVEDCQARHAGYGGNGISHKDIAAEARVSLSDLYRWRDNNPRIGPSTGEFYL
jgi:hypothetical protein